MKNKAIFRLLFFTILILTLFLGGILPAAAASLPTVNGEVAIDNLNLRAAPGFYSKVLRLLEEGQEVSVLGRSLNRYWLQVRLADGMGGWVYASYIRLNTAIDYLPVTEASGGPDGSSGNNSAVLGVYLTITEGTADLKLENFPKSQGIVARLGLPGKGTDLEVARGMTDASGRLEIRFIMPEEWSNGKPITQDYLLLEVSTSDGKIQQDVDVVYFQ